MKFFGLLALLGIAASTLSAQSNVTVEGVVVDSVTGVGITGSTVRLFNVGGGVAEGVVNILMHEILTNEVGIFQAAGLKPGDYTALAQKQGYSGTRMLPFHVNADGSPGPRLELTPLAILRGRVLGIDGKPARASVELGPGARDRVHTDEDGYFKFEQLTPGSYTLLGRPERADPVSVQEGSRTEAAPTYYPSAVQRIQAEPIVVRAGAEQTGYEIRLQSAPVYRVSGVVLDPAGKPAPDALVQLGNAAAAALNGFSNGHQIFSIRSGPYTDVPDATLSTTTGDDGEFEFSSVRAGDWMLRAESDSIRDEIGQQDVIGFGSATISVVGRDLDDVRVQLVLPVDLSGSVEGTDDPKVSRSVAVTLSGDNGNSGGSSYPEANGVLRFEGVIPGRYRISAEAPGDYYVSVLMGSSDVTEQTVELASSSPAIRVILKRGGTVRWSLEQQDCCAVVLVPQSLTGVGHFVPGASASGGFLPALAARPPELTGIPPGEYDLIALDQFNPRTMADAQRLRELVPRAANVRVEAGSVSFVQLKINRAPD